MPVIVLADGSEELLVVTASEDGDDGDADDGDQSHEERILHETGATLIVAKASPEPVGHEVVADHV